MAKSSSERIQTGVRIEKRLLKVLKALAEYLDISLGDLIEGIVLYSFDGRSPFSSRSMKKIREIKKVYEFDWNSNHCFKSFDDDILNDNLQS